MSERGFLRTLSYSTAVAATALLVSCGGDGSSPEESASTETTVDVVDPGIAAHVEKTVPA